MCGIAVREKRRGTKEEEEREKEYGKEERYETRKKGKGAKEGNGPAREAVGCGACYTFVAVVARAQPRTHKGRRNPCDRPRCLPSQIANGHPAEPQAPLLALSHSPLTSRPVVDGTFIFVFYALGHHGAVSKTSRAGEAGGRSPP